MEAAIYENRRTLEAIKETRVSGICSRTSSPRPPTMLRRSMCGGAAEKNRLRAGPQGQVRARRASVACWPKRSSAPSIWRTRWISSPTAKMLTDELESAAETPGQGDGGRGPTKEDCPLSRRSGGAGRQKLEQQQAVVEEIHGQLLEVEERKELAQAEVDSLKTQPPTTSRRWTFNRPAPSSTARRCRRWRMPASSASCRG